MSLNPRRLVKKIMISEIKEEKIFFLFLSLSSKIREREYCAVKSVVVTLKKRIIEKATPVQFEIKKARKIRGIVENKTISSLIKIETITVPIKSVKISAETTEISLICFFERPSPLSKRTLFAVTKLQQQ